MPPLNVGALKGRQENTPNDSDAEPVFTKKNTMKSGNRSGPKSFSDVYCPEQSAAEATGRKWGTATDFRSPDRRVVHASRAEIGWLSPFFAALGLSPRAG